VENLKWGALWTKRTRRWRRCAAFPATRRRRGTNISRVTDVADFLDEDPKKFWCGRVEKSKNRVRWTESITVEDLTARITADYAEIGRVTALTPKSRGVSGRIQVLTIVGEKGSVDIAGDLKIRRTLGGLKSTLFEVKREGNRFTFRGAGFGHGVGMCQLGAIGMADAGKPHKEILGHYYRGTHLHKLY
jgi:SpoIID/LytB domain protein